ncbi:MAG: hypothetical protein RBT80_14920 [Candidatus Vecturithrix sp.]|jgi:hypothetical protein|nr:hypothetical protein [Candidatus Vecturithrix sp.]
MNSFSGPADIYEELVENVPENEEWLLGLVAFAVVEEQKIEWMKHYAENNAGPPSETDIKGWYQQQPQGALLRAKDTARTRLTSYAQDAITTYMAEFEKETVEGIIVEEIREIKRFWPQFGVNLAGGFASSILFASLLIIIAFFVFNDSSPVQIGAKIGDPAQEVNHGKEN